MKNKKALLMDNGDHDHREQLELQVGGKQVSNILTAGSLTSRLQSRGEIAVLSLVLGLRTMSAQGTISMVSLLLASGLRQLIGCTISFGTLLA